MTQLFEATVDGKTKFAHKLAVNSEGKWVMEEKGTGDVFSIDKKDVEEVIPYTVSIQFQGSSNSYNYTSVKGKYKVGDVILMPSMKYEGFSVAVIQEVDTKSKMATKELKPISKLLTETP